jgi:hypothetical protein
MVITRLLWSLGALCLPLLGSAWVLFFVGPVALLLCLGLFWLILRSIGLQNLLGIVGLLALLGRSNRGFRDAQVPVHYLDVRDTQAERWRARMKGFLTHANLRPGDAVCLRGRWRQGVFFIRGGYIQNAGHAHLVLRRERRWTWRLFVTLGVYTLLGSVFYPQMVMLFRLLSM